MFFHTVWKSFSAGLGEMETHGERRASDTMDELCRVVVLSKRANLNRDDTLNRWMEQLRPWVLEIVQKHHVLHLQRVYSMPIPMSLENAADLMDIVRSDRTRAPKALPFFRLQMLARLVAGLLE